MGNMQADIRGIVSDIGHVDIYHVIFEAITNALQAGASLIKLKLKLDSNLFAEDGNLFVRSIIIEDNGEGFTKENIESFKTYRSAYKHNMGCKGIGRFLYLKLFEKVEILSAKTKIIFDFNGILESKLRNANTNTQICLLEPKSRCYVYNLSQRIHEHFIAYFQLEKRDITIEIYQEDSLLDIVSSNNRLDFERIQFSVGDYDFLLSYIFGNSALQSEGYYAANNRVVLKNSKLDNSKKLKLSDHIHILYILESAFLDSKVNNERNDFDILRKSELDFNEPSWNDINEALNECINDICLQHDIDIQEIINDNRKIAMNNVPYLHQYLQHNEELNIDSMIKCAQKAFIKDKEFIRNHKIIAANDSRLHRVMDTQLLEYIMQRRACFDILSNIINKRDVSTRIKEIFIHNDCASNAWIFDDRFIGYSNILHDFHIKELFPKLYEALDSDNALYIITNTYDRSYMHDILLIDFRRPEGGRHYFAKLSSQLLNYAMLIQNTLNRSARIWAYGFVKFSDEIIMDLASKDYIHMHVGSRFPICYKYHSLHNTMINLMDYEGLLYAARFRYKLSLQNLDI